MASLATPRDGQTLAPAGEPAGILGGPRSLAAYLAFMGVDSLDELEEKQLSLDVEKEAA
jgi:hypothetical protein